MSPSRSACPCRILKISFCLRSPLVPWWPSSLATLFRSAMVLSLSSDRFIRLPPAFVVTGGGGASVAGVGSGAVGLGEGRLGLRSEEEMVVLRRVACVQLAQLGWVTVRRDSLSHTVSDPVNSVFGRNCARPRGSHTRPHIRPSMIARCLISTNQTLRRASYFWR